MQKDGQHPFLLWMTGYMSVHANKKQIMLALSVSCQAVYLACNAAKIRKRIFGKKYLSRLPASEMTCSLNCVPRNRFHEKNIAAGHPENYTGDIPLPARCHLLCAGTLITSSTVNWLVMVWSVILREELLPEDTSITIGASSYVAASEDTGCLTKRPNSA